jgi:SAM-dependent methyltransferase
LENDPYDWKGRVGQNWALDYARTDRSFAGLTKVLVDRVRAKSPAYLLDIGCGAGETSIAIGEGCPKAEVLGIDLSEPLITAARLRSHALKNVRFGVADASSWHDPTFIPDTLMSRHGVMFFADPVGAFTTLRCSSKLGAQLIFSCFRDRLDNTWATEIGKLVGGDALPADPVAPGPFAFADKAHVTRILEAAGWQKVAFERVDWDYVAGDGFDPVADAVAYFQRIGPAASAITSLENTARANLLTALATLAENNLRGGRVAFDASAWIISAHAK